MSTALEGTHREALSREEILAGIERLAPWFHCIDLGEGIKTKNETYGSEPPDHPAGTWEIIRGALPDDLSGKTVLDVGCNAGFYSIEAKRRGASRVLGVDAQQHQIRQARFVRRALGLKIDYERLSVYDLDAGVIGQFDVTLALGLIYHCKHLVLALEKLFEVTRELLIIESAILPDEHAFQSFQYPVGGQTPLLHAVAFIENPTDVKEQIYNWFLPSVGALRVMLQTVGFARIDIFSQEGDRVVLVCNKSLPVMDSSSIGNLRSALLIESGPDSCQPAEEIKFEVGLKNIGWTRWLKSGQTPFDKGAVHLAAHLLDEHGDDISWYHAGAFLPHDIEPGESVRVEIRMKAPEKVGVFFIKFDMVAEHLAWFEDLGSDPVIHRIEVQTGH